MPDASDSTGRGRSRAPDRVRDVVPGGPTSQVDDRQSVLPPGEFEALDPFLMLSEDWFSETGFDWHPHRGFETVSLVLEGRLEHTDNAGGHGILGPGDVQWTTTGRGVLHAEVAHERRPVHMLQLWLNLPRDKKMVPPRYQDLRAENAPTLGEDGVAVRVFAGTVRGVQGPADLHWPASMITARFDAGGRFTHTVPGEHAAFLYVIDGALRVGPDETLVRKGQVAWFDAGAPGPTAIPLRAEDPTHVVAYSGLPIREPVYQHGPFVMTTRDEIIQTIRDYQSGAFGPVPHA